MLTAEKIRESAEQLQPTHSGFDDALRFCLIYNDPVSRAEFVIVHAICKGSFEDEPYVHAWIEAKDPRGSLSAIQGAKIRGNDETFFTAVERSIFYKHHTVIREVRYSFLDALVQMCQSETGGPWDPELVEVINRPGNGKRIVGESAYGTSLVFTQPASVADVSTQELFNSDPEVQLVVSSLTVPKAHRKKVFDYLADLDLRLERLP